MARGSFLWSRSSDSTAVRGLTSKRYAESLRATIDPVRATPSDKIRAGDPLAHEGDNTTHFSVADRDGNAVSNTYTLNFSYGVGLVAEGTGILLNNELDDFAAKPGAPNFYGLVGGEANAPGPGKRPLSSMTPTIVLKDGKPVLVTGSPGGSRIITAVLQTMINAIDYDMNVQEAVDAPRFHHQWMPDLTNVEPYALSPDTRRILEGMGHKLGAPHPANHLAAIIVGAPSLNGKPVGNNRFYGANDPRRNTGLAAGY